ncbi:MAG: helix-turn-helix domain-containing protein [Desulfobacterales bacterium]|nr:helix-turn-helix domain-containing protein [Desulfobacterales bacterium]
MNSPKYIDEQEVARITGRALSTLRNERFQRRGIQYYKIGRSVRYRLGDVIEFMEKHRIETEQHAGQKPAGKELFA